MYCKPGCSTVGSISARWQRLWRGIHGQVAQGLTYLEALPVRNPTIKLEHMTSQFAALAIDCADPSLLTKFW